MLILTPSNSNKNSNEVSYVDDVNVNDVNVNHKKRKYNRSEVGNLRHDKRLSLRVIQGINTLSFRLYVV